MPGKLIVCPTPIGNMEDLTPRVRRALSEADAIACEDTRRTGMLFDRMGIEPPQLISNHEGNEAERAVELAQRVERGERIALISDAGMPAISDPGYRAIRTCISRDLDIEVLPGPSAVPAALVASGLPPNRWRFEGYLPRRAGELERVLQSAETVVAFESPRRLPDSLSVHEEVARGTLSELARRFRGDVRGEIVLVIGPASEVSTQRDVGFAVDALRGLVQAGARPRAAASIVAALTGTSANDLYRALTGREPRV
jgi:16S rRNA (cytidine1402-2'-O)-methyltransferase